MHSAEKACDTTLDDENKIIECWNNTHQGAPHAGKQTCTYASDIGDSSHITCK